MTCPRSHRESVVELGTETRSPEPQSNGLTAGPFYTYPTKFLRIGWSPRYKWVCQSSCHRGLRIRLHVEVLMGFPARADMLTLVLIELAG